MSKLSIWIVGKDKEEFLPECIESCRKLTGDIIYLDLGSKDGSIAAAERAGIKTERNPLASPKTVCKSDWALFLRPNEKLTVEQRPHLLANIDREPKGYSLIIREDLAPELLDEFIWMKDSGYRHPSRHAYAYCKMEARLVRRKFFANGLKLMISTPDNVFSFESRLFKGIEVHCCREKEKETDPAEEIRDQIRHLRGDLPPDSKDMERMNEFCDNFLSFGVLTSEDMGRYYRGMEEGFGSERMYLIMIHYLNQFGRFEEARNFFEKWEASWEFFDTADPYRAAGLIYAQLFEMEKAVKNLEKFIESGIMNNRAETLSALGKCRLIMGEIPEGISMLEQALALRNDYYDRTLLEEVKKRNQTRSRLSVCMIVRDESASLARAIESVRHAADEILVVDTGSSDRTREIAAEYGCRVIQIPWEDDFAKARNAGLRELSGDYVLFLDADEFIDPRQRIRMALARFHLPAEKDTAFTIAIDEELEDEEMTIMLRLPKTDKPVFPIRLLPLGKDLNFEGAAFETPESSLRAAGMKIEWADFFRITHSVEDREWREDRKKPAIRKSFGHMRETNNLLKGILYFIKAGDLEEARGLFLDSDFADPRLRGRLITFFIQQGMEIRGQIESSRKRFPDDPYLKLAAAELAHREARHHEAIRLLGGGGFPGTMDGKDLARADYLLGTALLDEGRLEEGIERMISAREIEPRELLYKLGGIYAMGKSGHWEGVVEALDHVIRSERIDLEGTIDSLDGLGFILVRLGEVFLEKELLEESAVMQRLVEEMIAGRRPEMMRSVN
ncbi:MAG TPA: glycosyltransferase [Syntrophales bacterium]|nr:glycosyltransferase [Syntrophales bacterium]